MANPIKKAKQKKHKRSVSGLDQLIEQALNSVAQRNLPAATELLQQVLQQDAKHFQALQHLAGIYDLLGMVREAMLTYLRALAVKPSDQVCRQEFINTLNKDQLEDLTDEEQTQILQEICRCFQYKDIYYQSMSKRAARLLRTQHGLMIYNSGGSAILDPSVQQLFEDDNCLGYLQYCVNYDAVIEGCVVDWRRCQLESYNATGEVSESTKQQWVALAYSAYNCEYIYPISVEEQVVLKEIAAELARSLSQDQPLNVDSVLVYAAYLPLTDLKDCEVMYEQLAQQPLSSYMQQLFQTIIGESIEEQQLKSELASALDDGISDTTEQVKTMYEQNPYPRWRCASTLTDFGYLSRLTRGHPGFANVTLRKIHRILVAGCGTGQTSVMMATRFPGVKITAVDLSANSLAYALRMVRSYKIKSIELLQADITTLTKVIDEPFPWIECSGVLHHLADPVAGWRELRELLAENGLMQVALYSQLGRKDLKQARATIKALGAEATPDAMRQLRQDIMQGSYPELLAQLGHYSDFYTMSGFRDLCFHVQEREFTCLELQSIIADLKLQFVGFEGLSDSVLQQYRAQFPQDTSLTDLACWHQFEQENPDTFASMYKMLLVPA